jgi:hypothetical protein
LLAAVDASIARQSPWPSRPEEIRRLVKERLAGDAELRSRLIGIFRKVEALLARRDALAARVSRLEVREPRQPPNVERWPADPWSDPERDLVARAKAELAQAEAEQRSREELRSE